MSQSVRQSYCALRVRYGADTTDWWRAATDASWAPPAIGVLLAGRSRVEVSAEEADQTLSWAAALPGWADATPKPLFAYRPVDPVQ